MDNCLVGVCLVCGLVMCAEWLLCSRRVLESIGALERLLRGWWVRLGFPVHTECTTVQDYGFPVRPGNPLGAALLCPVWLWGMAEVVWLHCSCGWVSDGLGHLSGGFLWGLWNSLVGPTPTVQTVVVGRVVALFAIPALTFWGWLMGPHSGLSLWGSTGCPAPLWNVKHDTTS